MSEWGTADPNANRIKQTYIKGFLDISGGNMIIEKSSTLQMMSSDYEGQAALIIKPDRLSVFASSTSYDISYTTFAALGTLGVSYENSTVELMGRTKFLASSTLNGNNTIVGNNTTLSDLTVYGDIYGRRNIFVTGDASFNGKLYVVNPALFGSDMSLNGNVKLGSGNRSVAINKDISSAFALDVSGLTILRKTLYVDSDVSLNANLYVNNDLSLNGNLYVVKRSVFTLDVSMLGNLKVGSGSNSFSVNKDISAGIALDVSGLTILRNTLYVGSDVSLNANLYINNDLSLNGNLYVVKRSVFALDASFNGNVKLGSGNRSVAINKDISSAFALDVSGLTILRNTLYVGSDVSLNANLYVNNDLSLNGNLYVVKRSVFTLDVSMLGNLDIGSGSNSVAINKDISSAFALDVSGVTKFRGNMDVAGTFTVNGAPVSGSSGGALTGNVQVGTNSGFVTIDKPYFYADPSLTIYYNFDTSINTGTGIKNNATTSTLYDGLLNVNGSNTNSMIDTTVKKFGASSLKNNPIASNNGVTICNNSSPTTFPVSSSMSFSVWVYKPQTPLSGTFDRIFEISDLQSGGIDNNTIALDINSSGVVLPVLTYAGTATPCINNISLPIISYNVCNGIWNHIAWTITPTNSYIYINGSNTQIDIINNPVPITARKSAFVGYLLNNAATRDFSGNIDDFRYYKDKALNYAEIYQLYNNNFYTFDICGGFLSNGSSVIYEATGSKASANSGSLTLLHGDASGSSSIMFKSVNDPLEYGYIQYEENAVGSTGFHYGLMTIGIENDAGSGSYTAQADRVSLFPSGGTGFVGINTKTPLYSLDVSGILNTNANASINGVSIGRGAGNVATNTAVGFQAIVNTTGSYNNAVGAQALCNNTTGSYNNAVGGQALLNNTTGSFNTGVGHGAGFNVLYNGSNNTFLGALTDLSGSFNNSTAIGYGAQITESNQIVLGRSEEFVEIPGAQLRIKGTGARIILRGSGDAASNSFVLGNGIPNVLSQNRFGIALESASNISYSLPFQINTSGVIGIGYTDSFSTTTTDYLLNVNAGIEIKNALRIKANDARIILKGTDNAPGNSFLLCNGLSNVLSQNIFGIILESASSNYAIPFQINTSGVVAIGYSNSNIPTTSSYLLFVNGGIQGTQFNAISDYRIKENIVPLDESFTIDGLNPVTYNLKSTGRQDIGFIAHEVQEFYPFLVSGEKDGKDTQSLNYNGFIGILTKEIKVLKKKEAKALAKAAEQEARIAEQEARIAEQEAKALAKALAKAAEQDARISDQDQRIQALEKMVFDLINK